MDITETDTALDGLLYSDHFLSSLPTFDDHEPCSKQAPNAGPSNSGLKDEPIWALSASQFSDFHMQHTLAHPRDSVLFPFLHGLEGDNQAQNTFFASSSSPQGPTQHGPMHSHGHGQGQKITPRIPKYRGLVWVVCEDDLEKAADGVTLRVLRRKPLHGPDLLMSPPSSSSDELEEDEEEEESDDSCFEEDFEDDGLSMMVLDVNQTDKETSFDDEQLHYEGTHMHPVSHRSPTHLNINIDICPSTSHHSASSSSEASTSTSTPSSTGSTPNSSIYSPDAASFSPLSDSSLSPATTAGSGSCIDSMDFATPMNSASLQQQEEDNPSTPCAKPSPLPLPTGTTSVPVQIPVTIESHPYLPSDSGSSSIRERSPPRSMRSFRSKHGKKKVCLDPCNPPLLTSTFRPKELVRRVRVPSSSKKDPDREKVKRGLLVHPFRPPPPSGSASSLKCTINEDENANQRLEDGEENDTGSWTWEFVPAKVPDGISLRNFGIQVPVYATLSDVVIYSPYGATPSALSLARKFREAIKAKRLERMRNAGVDVDLLYDAEEGGNVNVTMENGNEVYGGIIELEPSSTSPSLSSPPSSREPPFPFFSHSSNANHNHPQQQQPTTHLQPATPMSALKPQTHTEISIPAASKADLKAKAKEAADGFVQYRVFVLDADEDEMRSVMPHLMMTIYKEGECRSGEGESEGTAALKPGHADRGHGAHTDGSDGHIIELGNVEEEERKKKREERVLPVAMDVEMNGMEASKEKEEDRGVGMDVDVPAMPSQAEEKANDKQEKDLESIDSPIPNTIDFALREKEEMRDLTKASAIITLHPEVLPTLGSASASSSATITRASSSTHLGSHTHQQPHTHTNAQTLLANSHQLPTFTFPFAPKDPVLLEDGATVGNPRFDPRIGQIFLGNSGDVPLAPDIPSQFRHAASGCGAVGVAKKGDLKGLTRHLRGVEGLAKEFLMDDDEERENSDKLDAQNKEDADIDTDLPHDDPFNYFATNDPEKGFGFDICIECHDLAPFPTAAHMRAAEEHLGMLDIMWKERWEAAWNAREEKRLLKKMEEFTSSSSDGVSSSPTPESPSRSSLRRRFRMTPPPPAPPRPPPHANAVIHLPFPSSPSNSQSTMVALMPLIRFLEKWIRPVTVPVLHAPTMPSIPKSPRPNTPPQLKNEVAMTFLIDEKRGAVTVTSPNVGTASSAMPPSSSGGSGSTSGSRRWSSVSALLPSFPSFPGVGGGVGAGSGSKDHRQPSQQIQLNNNNNGVGSTATMARGASPQPVAGPPNMPLPPHPSSRTRSLTSPSGQYPPSQVFQPPTPIHARSRPLKVLLYSADGYTESSVPALCLLMSIRGLGLPEAYLELQVERKRSFFVYQGDLGILKRVEGRLREERDREKDRERDRERERILAAANSVALSNALSGSINANGKRTAPMPASSQPPAVRAGGGVYWAGSANNSNSSSNSAGATRPPLGNGGSYMGRPAAKSVSFASRPHPAPSSTLPAQLDTQHASDVPRVSPTRGTTNNPSVISASGNLPNSIESKANPQPQFSSSSTNSGGPLIKGRPRAITSPWLPSLFAGDHQSWFNDPRFDGSFPSRVLPFLYLGNINHASNVYMLHALGITHVVSVGECALIPPPHHMTPHSTTTSACYYPGAGSQFKGPSGHGSLWFEEREGRIKVMDIKGVCDDGIDTLEPQLEPICDWIDKARQEGGQVLVHCRVGVSRSATVTIAYVMKHLNLPLVDAYLIVRSRRLSVLIQPNMRLLYNLCGWEIKLAKGRAKGDKQKLRQELARTLTWPYLAKEVHALNEKYLH